MGLKTIAFTLTADVATAGTFTIGYPTGYSRSDFFGGVNPKIRMTDGGMTLGSPNDFAITTYGASSMTVTYRGATTLKTGWRGFLEMQIPGPDNWLNPAPIDKVWEMRARRINLGNPIAASTTGVTTAQLLAAAGNLVLDGASVVDGVAVLDVPRNFTLTVATTNQSGITFTVTGADVYGNALVETLAGPNANTVAGKKAFKTITKVAASAPIATNGVSVGFGDVLGLPVFLPNAVFILKELEDGASATAGTTVAGLSPATKSTATTADVRGTYDPSSAADGSKVFELVVELSDPFHKGNPQFAG